jgi:hypothetical protein
MLQVAHTLCSASHEEWQILLVLVLEDVLSLVAIALHEALHGGMCNRHELPTNLVEHYLLF